MNVSVIIVAAGSGKRMKSAIAKQYLDLKGRSILSYTVEVFEESLLLKVEVKDSILLKMA